MTDEALVEIIAATRRYGKNAALDGVSLAVTRSEIVGILGPSGAGKTTLLRALALLEPLDAGQVLFHKALMRAARHLLDSGKALRAACGFVPQDLALWPHLSILDNVALPLVMGRGHPQAAAEKAAQALLVRFGLGERAKDLPHMLSMGQRQRIAIARALAPDPELLLLDEITSALDVELVEGVLQLIASLASDGRTLVFVTHHLDFAQRVATRIVMMEHGRIIEDREATDFFASPAMGRTRQFLARGHLEGRS